MSKTRYYGAWIAMIQRCYEPKHSAFKYYGGRGIKVCARWLDSFENFLADMGPRPNGMTLDRKDNNGNYEPSNCKWATRKEQQSNRRGVILVTIGDKTKTVADWANEFSISDPTVRGRIRRGMSPEAALITPANPLFRKKSLKNAQLK